MRAAKLSLPLFLSAALYSLMGGYVHLTEWLDIYRNIPSSVPGAFVVKVGFPLQAATAFALALVIVVAATKVPKLIGPALVANLLFQISSLGVLIATRVGSVLGWAEPQWTPGANQARAAELGAIVMTGLSLAVYRYLLLKGRVGRGSVVDALPAYVIDSDRQVA